MSDHDELKPRRYVVCAALRNSEGEIICGARHFDGVMHHQLLNLLSPRVCQSWELRESIEQGFIDQFGAFMDRKDAMFVAKNSGQHIDFERNGGDRDTLYSEGLYTCPAAEAQDVQEFARATAQLSQANARVAELQREVGSLTNSLNDTNGMLTKDVCALCNHLERADCHGMKAELRRQIATLTAQLAEARRDIDRLRGRLQSCVNLLHRTKRHGMASDARLADTEIDLSNRALYETLCGMKEPDNG